LPRGDDGSKHTRTLTAFTTTTRKVACDDLLVTLLNLVTEWYVFHDEMYVFVISCK
jgi:hypothetical protein